MPRAPRIDLQGALYHVISRGNERRSVFRTDRDRRDFLDRLSELACERAVRLFAYCLLDNHFHLLVERTTVPLGTAMKRMLTGYAVSFNLRHNRIGHLFHGRFKSPLCERDAYLLELVRYIHLNPVRARVVQRPEQYQWSSHLAYLGHDALPGLECEPILELFDHDPSEARARFQRFVEDGLANGSGHELPGAKRRTPEPEQRTAQNVHLGGAILGSRPFAEATIAAAHLRSTVAGDDEVFQIGLDEIARVVAKVIDLDFTALLRRGRRWKVARGRALLCAAAVDEFAWRPRELARYLRLTDGAISHALTRGRELQQTEAYRRVVATLSSQDPR